MGSDLNATFPKLSSNFSLTKKKNVKSLINVSIIGNSLPYQVNTWQGKNMLGGADSCDLHRHGMNGRAYLKQCAG